MTPRTRAELILLATTFIWGGTFVIMKLGFADVSPFLFVAIRFSLGSLIFYALFFRGLRRFSASTIRRGGVLGILLGVGLVLQTYGLRITTASKSAFITGMMVVFTPIAQLFIERRIPKIGNIIGVGVVTAGLYFLTLPSGSGLNLGDMLTLLGALLFGIYIVYLDLFTKEEPFLPLAFLQIVVTALIGWSLVPFESTHFELTWNTARLFFYTAFLATVITTYTQTRFQKDTTPTRAGILFTLEPVISAVLAYFVLGEVLGILGIIGGTIIVAGILISEFSDKFIANFHWKLKIAEEE
ncbi:MAG TPA: DMT family transporter [Bacteroidota bacterium]|nr:DMT family transporter [Bacteroidota bacterium]